MTRGAFAALAGLLLAASAAEGQQSIRGGTLTAGRLAFDGRATAGDFTGVTTSVTGVLDSAPELAAASGWVEAPVRTLATGNGRRDRDLNKSMESDKYPALRFELERVTPGAGPADSLPVTLHGRLVLHGVAREVELPGVLSLSDSTARVRSDFPLNLKDYRIGGLSKALGLLKMYEDIVVHVDVTFSFQ